MTECLYHKADLDGLCSGAIVSMFEKNCRMVGIDYGEKYDPPKPEEIEKLYLVDFSFQPIEKMVELADYLGREKIIWIDHHKSAIEEAKRVGLDSLPGAREIGKAGCELAWEYFNHHGVDAPTPEAVRLLGRYDVWDLQKGVLAFQYGMRSKAKGYDSPVWESILHNNLQALTATKEILREGEAILEYVKLDNEKYLTSCGFESQLEGHTAIVLNRLASSQAFEGSYDPSKHDMMIAFVRKNAAWRISLFSTKSGVDCSTIAKKYGGGGHKGAAGFICDTLPFKI